MPKAPGEFMPISEEHPYHPAGSVDASLDNSKPYACLRCGSRHTSSYTKLMVSSGPIQTLSGDLVFKPVDVIMCMSCGSTWYHCASVTRDS